jgi:hypothetical protein
MTTTDNDGSNKSKVLQKKIIEDGHVPIGRAGSDEEMGIGVLFLMKNRYVNGGYCQY